MASPSSVESPSTTPSWPMSVTRPLTESRQPVGFAVDGAGRRQILPVREELGDEQRLIGQPALDRGALLVPQLPRDDERDQHQCSG